MFRKYYNMACEKVMLMLVIHKFIIQEKKRAEKERKELNEEKKVLGDGIDLEELKREEEKLFRAWRESSDQCFEDILKQRQLLIDRLKAKKATSTANKRRSGKETQMRTSKQEESTNDRQETRKNATKKRQKVSVSNIYYFVKAIEN